MSSSFEVVVKPRKGLQALDLAETYYYRELLAFLALRDIKIRYRQTALGILWAVLQPLLGMFIFTLIFNRMGAVRSDGPPYPLFVYTGLAPWTFFANAVTQSSNSLVGNQQLVSKVYFPRILIPLASISALLLDLIISLAILAVLMLHYHWPVSPHLIWLPLFVLGSFLAASGVGITLSALNVMFRDVKYIVPFCVQMGLFVTPVIYPLHYLPLRLQLLIGFNPMAGMVLGFRHTLLGTPLSSTLAGISLAVSAGLFIMGLLVFRRTERVFADII
jgi:lipopolysaccharide transport system permease protein